MLAFAVCLPMLPGSSVLPSTLWPTMERPHRKANANANVLVKDELKEGACTEMDFIVDPRLREISARPCLGVA